MNPLAGALGALGVAALGWWRYRSIKPGDRVSVNFPVQPGFTIQTEATVVSVDETGYVLTEKPTMPTATPPATLHVDKSAVLANLTPRLF